MSHPVALVTGGNRSIGLQVAKDLYAKGFSVVLGCRDAQKARNAISEISASVPKPTEGQKLSFVVLDLADAESIPRAVSDFKAQSDRLDVLVNNAAILDESRKATLETNYFNTIAVTEAFLPLLTASAPKTATKKGRVVIVSSRMGCFNWAEIKGDVLAALSDPKDLNQINALANAWAAGDNTAGFGSLPYSQSKALISAYGRILAARLAQEKVPVDVVVTCPGYTKTDMAPNGIKTVQDGADTISWAAYDAGVENGKFYGERAEVAYDKVDIPGAPAAKDE